MSRVSRDTVRLVAFSDGVFAITITLLILEIRPPGDEDESLLHGLLELWPSYLTAVAFYGIAFGVTALTFNGVWQYAWRHDLVRETLGRAGARAIARRFQLALAWLSTGALLGALVPAGGVAVIVAFNAYYWLPIRGESPA